VTLDVVAGCVVPFDVGWYSAGYNAVMHPLLKDKFEKDIFEECYEQAEVESRIRLDELKAQLERGRQ
jgi:hypothetical protein